MRYTEAMAQRSIAFARVAAVAALLAAPSVAMAQSDPVGGFFNNLLSGTNPFSSKPAEKKAPPPPREVPPGQAGKAANDAANNPVKPQEPRGDGNAQGANQAGRAGNAPARDLAAVPSDREVPAALPSAERGAPLPPRRPAGLGDSAATAALGFAAQPQAVRNAVEQQPAVIPTGPQAGLARVNAFLNSFERITGTFVQLNPDGQRVGGALLLQRPGQLHFKYDPPSTLEVIADGRSVAVREGRYPQQVYSMSETPLKFLLKERVDLAADMRVVNVKTEPDGLIHVSLEDTGTIGGTSKITLTFDAKANVLKRWDVVDPQGYRTSVALNDLTVTKRAGLN